MKVPTGYYFRFYLTNTIVGLSCCLFLSFFPSLAITAILYPYSVYFLFFIFFAHQAYIIRSYLNPFRGNFEYSYLGRKIAKKVNSTIAQHYGWFRLFMLWLDEFSYIGAVRDDFYKEILDNKMLMDDQEFKFSFYMRLARIRAKQDDISIEKEYLDKASKIKPNHPVTLFRLGQNNEKEGDSEAAIKQYQKLLEVQLTDSNAFKSFVSRQIERINKNGPSRRPPNPGLRFAIMY